jgi:transcriptional regulator with XRE-family HTH domain
LEISQRDLAQALGVTPQHISFVEQDRRTPSLTFVAKLAEELGVTIDYLVNGREGGSTDIIPAIKADKTLKLDVKRALIALVQQFRNPDIDQATDSIEESN